jgi:DNA invertase Pin-like site-specific DNA recombinase
MGSRTNSGEAVAKIGATSVNIVGYARVSTDRQTLDAQIAALKAAGCTKIFSEKQSGTKTDRAELAKAIKALGAGDVLIVTRLDRLARSTRDLLNTLDEIGKVEAGFKSLADLWADTTTPHGRLMLTILGGLAEFERHLIAARAQEGRKRAVANGVKLGRKAKLTPRQLREAARRRAAGETLTDLAKSYSTTHATILRSLQRLETELPHDQGHQTNRRRNGEHRMVEQSDR